MNILWICAQDEGQACPLETSQGLSLTLADTGDEALERMRAGRFDAAVLNAPVPDWESGELLEELARLRPDVPVLIRNARPDLSEAVRLTKLGAFHFVDRSVSAGALRMILEAACEQVRAERHDSGADESWSSLLIGRSAAIGNLLDSIRLLGPRRCTVLITGETGTGKELVARALHLAGNRAQHPMVAVNCSALPENLLEAELFGHVRGAFTGAVAQRAGRFEQAHRGTLFLDEIAEMPLEVQTKLLRVLQEREFQRLGSSETIRVDVRVVAACNVDLGERAHDGRFREDLYYRLNVIPIQLPPLRDRLEDVPLLIRHFISKVATAEGLPEKQLSREAADRLTRYHWPGNVRQLENLVEMAMILSGDREVLYPADFRLPGPSAVRLPQRPAVTPITVPEHGLDFERTVGAIERNILEQALQKTKGNKKQAAEMLGLKRTTLAAKLKSLEALAV